MEDNIFLIKKLLKFAKQQQDALNQSNVEKFEEIGNKREDIICQMQKKDMNNQQLNKEQIDLIEEINKIDRENAKELQKLKQNIQKQLSSLRKNKEINMKYTNQYSGMYSGRNFEK